MRRTGLTPPPPDEFDDTMILDPPSVSPEASTIVGPALGDVMEMEEPVEVEEQEKVLLKYRPVTLLKLCSSRTRKTKRRRRKRRRGRRGRRRRRRRKRRRRARAKARARARVVCGRGGSASRTRWKRRLRHPRPAPPSLRLRLRLHDQSGHSERARSSRNILIFLKTMSSSLKIDLQQRISSNLLLYIPVLDCE